MSNQKTENCESSLGMTKSSRFDHGYRKVGSYSDHHLQKYSIILANDGSNSVMVIEKVLFDQEELEESLSKIASVSQIQHSNILSLQDYSVSESRTKKSVVFSLMKFYDLPGKSMASSFINDLQPINKNSSTSSSTVIILRKMIYDLIQANFYLNSKNRFHGCISPSVIYFYEDALNFKLSLVNACDNGVYRSHLELMLNNQPIFVSPLIASSLKNKEIDRIKHDPIKSDVFSLGLTILKIGLGKEFVSVYDNKGNFRRKEFKKGIQSMAKRFNNDTFIMNNVQKMLELNEENRPTFAELKVQTDSFAEQSKISNGIHHRVQFSYAQDKSTTFDKKIQYSCNNFQIGSNNVDLTSSQIRNNNYYKSPQAPKYSVNPFYSHLTEEDVSENKTYSKAFCSQNEFYNPSIADSRFNNVVNEPCLMPDIPLHQVSIQNSRIPQSLHNTQSYRIDNSSRNSLSYRSISPSPQSHFNTQNQNCRETVGIKNQPTPNINFEIVCNDNFFNFDENKNNTAVQNVMAPIQSPASHTTVTKHYKTFTISPYNTPYIDKSQNIHPSNCNSPFVRNFITNKYNEDSASKYQNSSRTINTRKEIPLQTNGFYSTATNTLQNVVANFKTQEYSNNDTQKSVFNQPELLISTKNTGRVELIEGVLYKEVIREYELKNESNLRQIRVITEFIKVNQETTPRLTSRRSLFQQTHVPSLSPVVSPIKHPLQSNFSSRHVKIEDPSIKENYSCKNSPSPVRGRILSSVRSITPSSTNLSNFRGN
jgi:hypothetical protein